MSNALDQLHHVAIVVQDITEAVEWYQKHFRCEIVYRDATWAMLKFANAYLAFVLPGQHPPHLGFATPRAREFGELKRHRDGSESIYVSDCSGNSVELVAPETLPPEMR